MAGGAKNCRHCGAPIEFIQRGVRWIPIEPGTEDRHQCPKVTVYCETCRNPFKGASWMKQCPNCYKAGRSSRPSEAAASPPRERERLKDDQDDDVPF